MSLNIKDIAKLAGVSPATVSRVINNSGNVNEENKERVLKVLEETGYKPNALARGLIHKKTNTLGIVVPDISNINFSEFVKGIENQARSYDYNIILTTSENNFNKEVECFEMFKEKRVDGIIFSGTRFTEKHKSELDNSTIPFLVFGQNFEHEKIISININNQKAAYDATKLLFSKGAKNIAMIGGPLWDRAAGYDRFMGFLSASVERGLKPNELIYEEGDFTIKSGYNLMKAILNKKKIDAILAANDFMALGAIKCLADLGYSVPNEVQVMGFDDNIIAEIYNPSLTTVKINFYEAGKIAAKAIIDKINKLKVDKYIELKYELVIRKSTI
ncbi:MAG: LacI family transcriptional regulator [Clostridiales bacterium]|nr:LacI family transcriptional regulator [Clostridiales bacterium]